ncbi:hypothetical protein bcgnr5409_35990 [Bacillus cereus]
MKVLVIMAAIDYIIGVFVADYSRELKSKVDFKGIAKKVVPFLLSHNCIDSSRCNYGDSAS